MAVGDESSDTRERIIRTATGLFAGLGYDGTSSRLIADAAGVDTATLAEHAGTKREVYIAVMERAYRAESQVIEAAVSRFTPDSAGVRRLADQFLDFCVAHPEVTALWIQRWLWDAADVTPLEGLYIRPMFAMTVEALRKVARPDADVEYALLSAIWCVHGFIQSGVFDRQGQRHGPENPKTLARFRAQLHRILERSLGLA